MRYHTRNSHKSCNNTKMENNMRRLVGANAKLRIENIDLQNIIKEINDDFSKLLSEYRSLNEEHKELVSKLETAQEKIRLYQIIIRNITDICDQMKTIE